MSARLARLRVHLNGARVPPKHGRLITVANLQTRLVQTRSLSTTSGPSNTTTPGWLLHGNSVRVSTLFTALLALGVGATALGLYEIYTSFTLWPVTLRKDLRAGISAKNQGDVALSERYLARAFQTALDLPLSVLGSDPYLKLSGIAAVLAEVSPERRAKEVLRRAWDRGNVPIPASSDSSEDTNKNDDDWATYTLTNEERLRRVAVACKLAELCTPEDEQEEERWLVWAVEEVLQLAGVRSRDADAVAVSGPDEASTTGVILAELALPNWMRRVDLGAPLAALGSVYARKGNVEYAMPLYLQAISLLLPPNMGNVPVEDRCEAAQLMNNLSELIMRRPPTPEIRHQAEAWARQAHGLIERVQETPLSPPRKGWFSSGEEQNTQREVCDQVLGVVLFNLGSLREMDDDLPTARSLYEQSLRQCERVGMNEGVVQSKLALRRVGRGGNAV